MSGSNDGIVIATIGGGGGAAGIAVATMPDTGIGAAAVMSSFLSYLLLSAVVAAMFICIVIAVSAHMRSRR